MIFDNREYNIKFLVNIEIIEYIFVNEKIARILYEKFQIRSLSLFKSKYFSCFNNARVKFITYVIYSKFIIQNYIELFTFIFITKIKSHFIIINKFWINAHEIILNIKIDSLIFKRERCNYFKILKKTNTREIFSRFFKKL